MERVRRRFAKSRLQRALERKTQDRPSRARKLDGAAEAKLVALACTEAPKGHARWTMKLLAEKLVEVRAVDSVDPATVGRVLKKTT